MMNELEKSDSSIVAMSNRTARRNTNAGSGLPQHNLGAHHCSHLHILGADSHLTNAEIMPSQSMAVRVYLMFPVTQDVFFQKLLELSGSYQECRETNGPHYHDIASATPA
jgi:hypothetical protein